MAHILVVANQTLGGQQLLDTLRARIAEPGDHRLTVVVPAGPSQQTWSHTHDEDRAAAQQRLSMALERFRSLGVPVEGHVGDARPVDAVLDAMREQPDVDEIVISTLPPAVSKWLRLDIISRLERAVRVPVQHVIGAREPVPA